MTEQTLKHWFQAFQVDALICLDSWSGIALFYIPVLSMGPGTWKQGQ